MTDSGCCGCRSKESSFAGEKTCCDAEEVDYGKTIRKKTRCSLVFFLIKSLNVLFYLLF